VHERVHTLATCVRSYVVADEATPQTLGVERHNSSLSLSLSLSPAHPDVDDAVNLSACPPRVRATARLSAGTLSSVASLLWKSSQILEKPAQLSRRTPSAIAMRAGLGELLQLLELGN